eukprot:CAMPEP_0117699000 /NCGR_PEP_ID=MMETSP0804-20121206/30046_1 /TAXON_ID=1074897 /ORGANISM="Tetraselmis astigmatica, Strain CCMP880" /LENGTH=109 /DNA_ID=CAMNT_0005513323 /DNA_START=224 /DNA_END=553 /DNA_ORIENTATION=-
MAEEGGEGRGDRRQSAFRRLRDIARQPSLYIIPLVPMPVPLHPWLKLSRRVDVLSICVVNDVGGLRGTRPDDGWGPARPDLHLPIKGRLQHELHVHVVPDRLLLSQRRG